MKLKSIDYPFVLLTSAMNGGAQGEKGPAEVRIASIRGQVRAWHSRIGLSPACDEVWGCATDGAVTASRVALSLLPHPPIQQLEQPAFILPHHDGGGTRPAVKRDQTFTLRLTRLIGCTAAHWEAAQKALKIWLLLGGFGLRSARAAGSVWPLGAWVPTDETTLRSTLLTLGLRNVSVATAGLSAGADAGTLRKTASDTVEEIAVFGSIRPRTPSPTKFKVARLATGHCLIVTADQRPVPIRGVTKPMIQHAEFMLNNKPQPARWAALGTWNHLIP